MKSLRTVQKLSKAGKIISKIVFICCIVGFVCCFIGIICLVCIPKGIQINGMTIQGIIEKESEISIAEIYASMIAAMIICGGEIVTSMFAVRYFTNELAAGTPFTYEGSKEILRLGIISIAVSLLTTALAALTYAIIGSMFKTGTEPEINNSVSVGIGIVFLVLSLIFRYGADLRAEKGNSETESVENTVKTNR